METLQNLTIISNAGADSVELRWLIKQLKIPYSPTFVQLPKAGLSLKEFEACLPNEGRVIYCQTPYPDVSDSELRGLYRNDTHGRKLENGLVLKPGGLASQLPQILDYFAIQISLHEKIQLKKALEKQEPPSSPKSKSSLFYEDRRTLLNNSCHLSDTAIKAIDLRAPSPSNIPVITDEIPLDPAGVITLINASLDPAVAKKLIRQAPPGFASTYVAIIFSHFDVIRPFLQDPYFAQFLEEKSLQLWHESEWKQQALYTCSNPRSPLTLCKHFFGQKNDPLIEEIQSLLRTVEHRYVLATHQSTAECAAYYKSSLFEKRLEEVAQGATPRVQVDCACSSVAVKQYSRNIARALESLGCEVLIHPPCQGAQRDLYMATQIELRKFQPDMIITSPNNIFRHKVFPQIQVPVLIPVQDQEPHIVLPRVLPNQPLMKWDLLLLMQERFVEPVIASGTAKEQVYHSLLPAEEPLIDDQIECSPTVGLIKTMPERLGLKHLVKASQAPDLEMCQFIEEEIDHRVQIRDPLPIDVCTNLAHPRDWGPQILAYSHQRMCFDHALALHNAKIPLALYGSNWEQMEPLAKYSHGHVGDRASYQKQFVQNQINLSLNPWNEYHPRVLDGGRLGAFFLVHQVPEAQRWQSLPSDLIPGEHFVYFTHLEDLVEKCRYYLARPEACREIGRNLQEKVKERYSYTRAATELLERFRQLIRLNQSANSLSDLG